MKNTRNLSIVLLLIVMAGLGCGSLTGGKSGGGSGGDANSNAVAETTGIPECDKLFARIEEKVSDKNKETTFFQRTAYNLIKDQIASSIRSEVANRTEADKKDIANKCTEAIAEIDKQEQRDANKK